MAAGQEESELARTLKQIIEVRSWKQQGRSAVAAAGDSVILFGKKLSVGGGAACSSGEAQSSDAGKLQLSEKLPPSAIVHLKELHEQRLKRREATQEIQSDLAAENERAEVVEGAPLTLFYNGMVYVFDDITDHMAQAMMILAGNATASSASQTKKLLRGAAAKESKPAAAMPSFSLDARKASLHRFLEKRKDRLFANSDKESFSSKSKTPPRSPPRKQQQLHREIQLSLQIY